MQENSIDLVLTDPPYPNLKGETVLNKAGTRGRGVATVKNTTLTVGTPWDTSLDWISEAWRVTQLGMMIFCTYHSLSMIQSECSKLGAQIVGLITWYKRNAPNPVNNVPKYNTEFVWIFKKSPGLKWRGISQMYDIPAVPGGCIGNERIKDSDGKTAHPTQKPVALIRELLQVEPQSVIDTHMGTGTTGVACVEKGIDFIGCEIEKKYFAIAEKRIEQTSRQGLLFGAPANNGVNADKARAEQLSIV